MELLSSLAAALAIGLLLSLGGTIVCLVLYGRARWGEDERETKKYEVEKPSGHETFSRIAGEMYMSEADETERLFKQQTITSLVDYGFIEPPPSVWERSNKKECIEFRRKFDLFWERYNTMLLYYLETLLNTALDEEEKERCYMIKERLFWSEPKREQSTDHGSGDRRAAGDKNG